MKGVRIPVLDKGYVQLEDLMGGDQAVIRGARICYQSVASGPEADLRLIHRLLKGEPRHNTPFEHATFRFAVKCPLFVARQWMRHRIASYNERSLRYCVADREYYIPQEKEGVEEYIEHMEKGFDLYEELLERRWKPERARGVLGMATYTEFIWTVNAWSLMNWLHKRLDEASQWEHRQYAKGILQIFEEAMPITSQAFKEHILKR